MTSFFISTTTPRILISGSQPDLEQWFDAADVAIYPREGASGVITRVLDYLAHQLPVVTTSAGARGLRHLESSLDITTIEEFPAFLSELPKFRPETTEILEEIHGSAKVRSKLEAIYRGLVE